MSWGCTFIFRKTMNHHITESSGPRWCFMQQIITILNNTFKPAFVSSYTHSPHRKQNITGTMGKLLLKMGNIIFQFSSMAAHNIVLVSFYHLAMFFLLQSKLLVNDNGFHQRKKMKEKQDRMFFVWERCVSYVKKKKEVNYTFITHMLSWWLRKL